MEAHRRQGQVSCGQETTRGRHATGRRGRLVPTSKLARAVISSLALALAALALSLAAPQASVAAPADATAPTPDAAASDASATSDTIVASSPVSSVSAVAHGIRCDAIREEAPDGSTCFVLFLPSHPLPSEFSVIVSDSAGRRLPLRVSDDENDPGRLRLPDGTYPSPPLTDATARQLEETGSATAWLWAVPAEGAVSASEIPPVRLELMQSARTQSVFVTTGRPRSWVEAQKGNEATGRVTSYDENGNVAYAGDLTYMRGRGNATWGAPKKPYNMRLADKADLIGTGEPHRSWSLLADYFDRSGLRNLVSLRFAKQMGIWETSDCKPCDLWWNGEYRGSYLIAEKIGTWSGGIDVRDLEDDYDDANEGTETDGAYRSPVVEKGTTDIGAISYAAGVADPPRAVAGDLEGLLVEHDGRYEPEVGWFETSVGVFVIKSPDVPSEYLVTEAQERFERAFSLLWSGEESDEDGSTLADYFDVPSLARCGWLYAVCGELDYMVISSSYFYVAGDGLIHTGPAWDFDLTWYNRGDPALDNTKYVGRFEQMALDEGNEVLWAEIASVNPTMGQLIDDVLLGDADAATPDGRLRSVSYEWHDRERSRAMNGRLWGVSERDSRRSRNQLVSALAERSETYGEKLAEWEAKHEDYLAALAGDGVGDQDGDAGKR